MWRFLGAVTRGPLATVEASDMGSFEMHGLGGGHGTLDTTGL